MRLLDQRHLPGAERYVLLTDAAQVAEAIAQLVVRGAPAIGIVAAYGMALAARSGQCLERAYRLLLAARPTAVNLKWALDRMLERARGADGAQLASRLEREAVAIHQQDIELCRAVGRHGAALIPPGGRVLTHCNAGGLATGGYGTALGVIRAAHARGDGVSVWATETRPVWQGARLTAWELARDGIRVTVVTDGAAGYLMATGQVDLVLVGADRVSLSGHVANKIGTYMLAVLAHHHRLPCYVALPHSTLDPDAAALEQGVIEHRPAAELTHASGQRLVPVGAEILNPAFDITPPELVTAFVTDRGIVRPPFADGLGEILRGRDLGCLS